MKKRLFAMLLVLAMVFSLVACGGSSDSGEEASDEGAATEESGEEAEAGSEEKPETSTVRWNCGTSGNVLLTIAQDKGYFDEEGIQIEIVPADANADALTMLATGKVDVVSNAGTSNPLQQISSGIDLTIFGGHMVTGCMPVVAKKGTKWNGVEDLIGKKFACNPSYFAFTGAVMDLGYDDPLNALEWTTYTDYNDALAAVVRGEVDYALMGTGQNYTVQNMDDVDIMCYQSDVMPNYSCCRMESQTEFVKNNPITIKKILKCLLRAQKDYEADKEAAVKLLAKDINAEEDYVAAYMLDDKHYNVSVDPLKNSVIRAWGILDKTGFLKDQAKDINIEDHINTEIYEQALSELADGASGDDAAFYEKMQSFYDENDK